MDLNKLTFGFSKVHYAPYTEGANGAVGTWAKPKPIMGAVTLSLKASGDSATFYADNGDFYSRTQDNGFTGDLTMAKFPAEFLVDVLGWAKDDNGMLIEAANAPQKPFALLFEVDGTDSPLRVAVYRCIGSKPTKDIQTNEASPKFAGEVMTITAGTIDFGWVTTAKASLVKSENSEEFDTFFDEVMIPKEPIEGVDG